MNVFFDESGDFARSFTFFRESFEQAALFFIRCGWIEQQIRSDLDFAG